jgi:hypothetical protein
MANDVTQYIFLVQNIHMHHIILQSFGRLVNFHVMLAMSGSYSCITTFHLLTYSNLNVVVRPNPPPVLVRGGFENHMSYVDNRRNMKFNFNSPPMH